MSSPDARYGFRVVGGVNELRRLVHATAAFVAHCTADPKAEPDCESYLSAFEYGDDFRSYFESRNTPRGYAGSCSSPWLWFDLDRDDPANALGDLRRLLGGLLFRYSEFDEDDLLVFFSGNKGFHIGLPLTHMPSPSAVFHLVCRKMAEGLAGTANVRIDSAIYDRVRLLRAPNSRHPKTGLHKRRFTHDELMGLNIDRIRELAAEPVGFDLGTVSATPPQLLADWQAAEAEVHEHRAVCAVAGAGSAERLNRDTTEGRPAQWLKLFHFACIFLKC